MLIFLLITPFITLQVGSKTCCITLSQEDGYEDCGADNTFQWQNVTDNWATLCTKLQFSPKNYTLTKNLKIAAVSNFIINGSGAIFQCISSSLIISNSTRVQIMDVKFINCGYLVKNFTKPNNLFPSFTKSAIILHNSFSITIMNTIFEDSPGYATIGVNLVGDSYFKNITVLHTGRIKPRYSKQQNLAGGIILVYCNMANNYSNVTLFIEQCYINNINNSNEIENKNEISIIPLGQLSVAVGLVFHQQLRYIEVQMHKLIVTNVTSVNRPLFLVLVHFIKFYSLSLTLKDNIFANNTQSLHQLVSCILNTTYPSSIQTIFTISNSTFYNNNATQILCMNSVTKKSIILLLEKSQIFNNSVTDILFSVSGVIPIFRNYTIFAYNTANIIFSFSKYIKLDKQAMVRIIGNEYNPYQKSFNRFIFEKTSQTSKECPFQLNRAFASIRFCDNKGYYRELYGSYLEYNCSWIENLKKEFEDDAHDFETKIKINSPEYTFRKTVFNCDKNEGFFQWHNSLFLCNHTLSKTPLHFIHPSVYPGQTATLKLLHLRERILLYTDFTDSSYVFTDILPVCQLDHSKHTIDLVCENCTNLSYTITTNITDSSVCLLKLQTATPENTLYVFGVSISQCPTGFSLDAYSGVCTCDPKLQAKLEGIECKISDVTFKLPTQSWMSKIQHKIAYTGFCSFDYCPVSQKFISLDSPDGQCLSSRSGIACGQCAEGLSTVFGTSRCKKCSNIGLLIIPILAVAGVLLVMMLFTLNLTVVNGNIYGFIVFVNILSICGLNIFATKKEVAYVLILLFNLDLGIETCFYNGMTAYVATWLHFVFPLYLLLIVVGLVISSRYIPRVEKITRKKVIPVIATIYLLSYNKIMTVTFTAFSYTKIHYLNSKSTNLYWSLDTDISVPSTKFIFLFLFCGITLIVLIIPINILLLFTKKCYRFKFVVTYLKAFIDAYQAPFEDDCRHLLGLELLLRATVYIVNCAHTKFAAAIYCAMTMLYAAYLCWQKPFKNKCNQFFYLLYIILLGGISIIFMQYTVLNTGPKGKYQVILNLLVYLAFIETLLIFIHHLWKHNLQYYKLFIAIETYIKTIINKFGTNKKHKCHIQLQELTVYEKYQEELLALSPNI